MEDGTEYLTPDQAAELLGVHRSRLYALYREGRMGRIVEGYIVFTAAEVQRYKTERDQRPRGGRPSFHNRPKGTDSPAAL
jgi:hypothetical protein